MRTLFVRLDDQTDSLLRAFCARTGQTQSDAVKAGIAVLAARSETPAQLAEDLGLVGCFDSGVGDLGRNHVQPFATTAREAVGQAPWLRPWSIPARWWPGWRGE